MTNRLQPVLKNGLILIRPLRLQDFESLYRVAKDPLIWKQHPCPNRYQRNEFELFFRDSIESKGALIIADRASEKVIGSSRYKELDTVDTAVEIGWTFLARQYWGGRYNLNVKALMIDYAFQYYDDIIFFVSESNIRSQKAIEKLCAKKTSETNYQSSSLSNDLAYHLHRDEWKQVKNEVLANANL